jgi:hypothetical protein
MVVDHAVDVGGDPPLVAQVELFECAVVPSARGSNERIVLAAIGSRAWNRKRCGG